MPQLLRQRKPAGSTEESTTPAKKQQKGSKARAAEAVSQQQPLAPSTSRRVWAGVALLLALASAIFEWPRYM
jgi:hypothetical protein